MQLEDHIGDVLRKMQTIFQIDAQEMIAASGLERSEWKNWIKNGILRDESKGKVKWSELGSLIGVESQRLKAIAEGWEPPAVDFEKWPGLANIQNYEEENSSQSSEPGYVNSYLLWSDEKKEAVLFDPGWKATKILAFLESKNLKLSQIFLTHSHRDHIQAKAELQQLFPEASFFDYNFYKDFASIPKQSFGPLSIQPCLAPGHSADHVVYRVDGFKGHSNMALIVGDCLFSGSLGYPFHNRNQLLETLRKQVFSLPPETLLCPGHGPLTILQTELDHNPFASHNSLKTDT